MHRFDTLTWPAASRIGILDERRLLVSLHEQATRASAFVLVSSQLLAAYIAPAPPARAQDDGLAPPVAATAGPAVVLAAPGSPTSGRRSQGSPTLPWTERLSLSSRIWTIPMSLSRAARRSCRTKCIRKQMTSL